MEPHHVTVDMVFGEHEPQAVMMRIDTLNQGTIFKWLWSLTLRHFEAVHGMSRVVRLIPDKLVTAATISKEGLVEDGTFLIDLVINLLTLFCKQANERKDDAIIDGGNRTETIFTFGADHDVPEQEPLSFEQVLEHFLAKTDQVRNTLNRRDLPLFKEQSLELLKEADAIRVACTIFIDMVHPTWITARRNPDDANPWDAFVAPCSDRLRRNGPDHLQAEFTTLAANEHLFD